MFLMRGLRENSCFFPDSFKDCCIIREISKKKNEEAFNFQKKIKQNRSAGISSILEKNKTRKKILLTIAKRKESIKYLM